MQSVLIDGHHKHPLVMTVATVLMNVGKAGSVNAFFVFFFDKSQSAKYNLNRPTSFKEIERWGKWRNVGQRVQTFIYKLDIWVYNGQHGNYS